MTALVCAAYLVLCLAGAAPLRRLLGGPQAAASGAPGVATVLCAFVLFFGGFFAWGAVELVFDVRAFDVRHASALIAVVVVTAWVWQLRAGEAAAGGGLAVGDDGGRPVPRLLLAATVLTFAALFAFTLAQRPRGFEVVAYQLPLAVHMMQTGSLVPWDSLYPHTFPASASVWFAYWLNFVPERLATVANFGFAVLAGAVVYRLARQIGADRRAASIAVCGLVSLPMVAFAVGELNADLGGAAWLGVALVFAFDHRAFARRWLFAGLALGIAFGFKSLHLVPLAVLGLLALVEPWQAGDDAISARLACGLRSLLQPLAGWCAMAGIWLARNQILFGSPLYPVNVPVLGTVLGWPIDPGVDFSQRHEMQLEWVTQSWHWIGYPWFERQAFGQQFKFNSGLGPFFAAAVPVAWAGALWACWLRGWRQTLALLTLTAGAAFVTAVWWVLDDRQPRYLLGAQLMLMPLTAWLLAAQPTARWRRTLERLFSGAILVMLFIVLSKEAILFGDRIVLSRMFTRAEYYEMPPVVDGLPAGTTILNLGSRTWHYPLFGEKLANRVVSTPRARALLGLPLSLDPVRGVVLRAAPLRDERVDYVFTDGGPVTTDGCLRLEEVFRRSVNPYSGAALPNPLVVKRQEVLS